MRLSRHVSRLRRDEGGFTLVELLSAITLLLTVLGTMTILMVSATTAEVDLTRRVQAQQQTRLALEKMRRDVHCATSTSLAPDASAATVTLALPTCPESGGETEVTWCTSGGGSRFVLRRIPGTPGSCTGGRPEADYLTQGDLFTLRTGLNRLAKLCTVFPVDIDPSDAERAYRLTDALVLRNSTPGTTGTQDPC